MTDRELKQCIKRAFPVPEPEHRQEFLAHHGGTQFVMSRRAFYLTQLGYIRKRIWLLSGLLMVLAVRMAYFIGNRSLEMGREKALLCCISAVVPLLAVLVIAEVNRSFTCGMNELEMSTRHNLLEVYLARGIFMGVGNFLWMCLALLLLVRETLLKQAGDAIPAEQVKALNAALQKIKKL